MTQQESRRPVWIWIVSAVAVLFGLLTLKEGGSVLFGDEAARAAAGNYVPFVLWFNFCAGFAYVIAGAGLWARQRWAAWLALAILLGTILMFAAFGVHIARGGAYEMRTVIAMGLRSLVWSGLFAVAYRRLLRRAAA